MQLHGPSASFQMAFITFCFIIGILPIISGVDGQVDPCQNYQLLNEVYRSTVYEVRDVGDALCDIDKAEGWYRFNEVSGGTMPEECVKMFHCGTVVPIWMNGHHPAVADNVVTRTVCANSGSVDCCDSSREIQVKNCGNFYVYYLYPTSACYTAYCAGDRIPCPLGEWSPNGFGPNCRNDDFPKLNNNPRFEGPNIVGSTFEFSCKVDFPAQDPDQRLEVVWLFDGQKDANIGAQVLSDPERTATLDGTLLKGHMRQEVGCKVRAYYRNGNGLDLTSSWLTSNVYWAGIKVEPGQVVVNEDGTDSQVTLNSTIPLVCTHDIRPTLCVVTVTLDANGHNIADATTTKCVYNLKGSDWNTSASTVSTKITVAAMQNKIGDGNRNTILSFNKISQPIGGPYMEVFTDYRLQSIRVFVNDTEAQKCVSTGDPHITGFKGNYFHHFETGVFTMYENTKDNFEYQMQTYPCNQGVSCACGIAIKEKKDVIRIDGCRNVWATPMVTVPTGELREGTIIKRSNEGRKITIYFPSQREVEVDVMEWPEGKNHLDVFFIVPAADIQGTSGGICGTLDKNLDADQYKYRDGTEHRLCHNCVQTDFAQSWRVTYENNLFFNVPQTNNKADYNLYCRCDEKDQEHQINCTVSTEDASQVYPCSGCKILAFGAKRRRRDAETNPLGLDDEDEPDPPEDFEIPTSGNYSIGWPTPSGITEAYARERCTQEMQKSQLWSRSSQFTSVVTNNLESCVTDIMYTDSLSWAESALASLTAQVQQELALDPSNYVNNSDGSRVMAPEISTNVCSVFCLHHGSCLNGQCVCDVGYAGDNCQLDGTKGPQLQRLRSSSYCDVNQKLCRTIFIDATNFQDSDSFLCKIQEVLENGQLSETAYTEEAEFLNSNRLACPLPNARVKTERWIKTFNVSVTNDGRMYGNELQVVVFDSTCQTCNESDGCRQKANTCLIDDLCYVDGDKRPGVANQECDISNSIYNWTITKGSVPSDGVMLGIGASFLAIPLFVLFLVVAMRRRL